VDTIFFKQTDILFNQPQGVDHSAAIKFVSINSSGGFYTIKFEIMWGLKCYFHFFFFKFLNSLFTKKIAFKLLFKQNQLSEFAP
jgi:hypothetical protein